LAVGVMAESWQPTWDNHVLRAAVLGILLVCVFGIFASGFRCPRCGASLIVKAATILHGGPCACSKCKVSIDESAKNPGNLT
jgi:hypothetical protein